ncbi:MAG TPA: hypothetical protein VGM10_08615 [Actinocrinis sp.]|jgi:hypothetical protein
MTTAAEMMYESHTALEPVRRTLLDVYADVRRDQLHLPWYSLEQYAERLDRHAAQPGWKAVVAYDGDEPVGSVYCTVVQPDDPWWDQMEEPLPEGFDQIPTITVQGLWLRAPWRKTGASMRLLETLISGRTEKRLIGLVNPEEGGGKVQALYESWGAKPFNSLRPAPKAPVHILVMYLFR